MSNPFNNKKNPIPYHQTPIFEEIMAENPPNLEKDINLHISETMCKPLALLDHEEITVKAILKDQWMKVTFLIHQEKMPFKAFIVLQEMQSKNR